MMDAPAPSHSEERFSMTGTITPDALAPGAAGRSTGRFPLLTPPIAGVGKRIIVRVPLATS